MRTLRQQLPDVPLIGMRKRVVGGELRQPPIAEMPCAAIANMQHMAPPSLQYKGRESRRSMLHRFRLAHAVQPAVKRGHHALRSRRRANRVGLIIQPLNQRADREFSSDPTAFAATDAVGQSGDHAVARAFIFSRAVNADEILIVRPLARFGRMASRQLQSAIRFQIKNSLVCVPMCAHAKGAVRGGVRQAQNQHRTGSITA